jgi:hypothetical protein
MVGATRTWKPGSAAHDADADLVSTTYETGRTFSGTRLWLWNDYYSLCKSAGHSGPPPQTATSIHRNDFEVWVEEWQAVNQPANKDSADWGNPGRNHKTNGQLD